MADIGGKWTYTGAAMQTDGTRLYAFTARVTIAPAGEAGAVHVILETDQKDSRSVSAAAVPRPLPGGGVVLLYDYAADPAHAATATHDFFGMVRLTFASDGRSAKGSYMNFKGRYTCGECRLERA